MYPCRHVYINTYNQATDFIYAGIYNTRVHAICLWICLYHIIDTVKQNISIVNQWTQKFSFDHQEVPACCGGMHDLLVFIFRVINDLCKHFPNHVSICLSLQDIRNVNFPLLSWCINVGSLELILVNKDWRSLILTRQLVTKWFQFLSPMMLVNLSVSSWFFDGDWTLFTPISRSGIIYMCTGMFLPYGAEHEIMWLTPAFTVYEYCPYSAVRFAVMDAMIHI